MKSSQITIKDIARELNISTSTVSRALRGLPDINQETKNAVVELANRLDYQPNQVALSLVKSRTYTIGVIVPSISYPFFSSAISGIEDVAIEAGYSVMVCQSNESYQREIVNTRDLLRSRVDGFIISLSRETKSYDHFRRLQSKGLPLVFFDRDCDQIDTSKVVVNNRDAAFQAVEHLILVGCRKIAFLAGPPSLSISNKRLEGYRAALKQYGLPDNPENVIHCDFDRENAKNATLELMRHANPPDGIFAVSDRVAIGALLALREMQLCVPEDVAVVGFNDEPIACLLTPSLSSVAQPTFEIGQTAAQLLLHQIKEGTGTYVPEIRVMKTKLMVRESSSRSVVHTQ